ncbi:MAG: hypothetical protein NT173_05795 [Opitutales bacterium]|nr:hypothetical protein [Opitutales bacterium]
MFKRLSALLMARRLSLKTEWERRLRAQPPNTALANPDVLVHRMDDSLERLDSLLSRHAKRWPEGHPPALARLRDPCRCGLNPLLGYFETGGAALLAVLPDLKETERSAVEQAWYFFAQQEVDSLCAVCCRCGRPEAALADTPAPAGAGA